jgi:hypothetical protein
MTDPCAIVTELAIELATLRQRLQIQRDLVALHLGRGQKKLGDFKPSPTEAPRLDITKPCPRPPSPMHVFPKGRWT